MKPVFRALFFVLAITIQTESFAARPIPNAYFNTVNHFDSLESHVKSLEDGRVILDHLLSSICLNNCSFPNIEKMHVYALSFLDKTNHSSLFKEKIKFIIDALLYERSPLGDIVNVTDEDIPGSLVLGGVEILVGSFVHLIPGCAWLGKLIIADGVRRCFNGLEDVDRNNKEKLAESSPVSLKHSTVLRLF